MQRTGSGNGIPPLAYRSGDVFSAADMKDANRISEDFEPDLFFIGIRLAPDGISAHEESAAGGVSLVNKEISSPAAILGE